MCQESVRLLHSIPMFQIAPPTRHALSARDVVAINGVPVIGVLTGQTLQFGITAMGIQQGPIKIRYSPVTVPLQLIQLYSKLILCRGYRGDQKQHIFTAYRPAILLRSRVAALVQSSACSSYLLHPSLPWVHSSKASSLSSSLACFDRNERVTRGEQGGMSAGISPCPG